ncbi:hypothetical protein [Flavobacterium cerinum]|uniref:Uncharacterized protein n=1 Tax=Flavobacterium cerinum TaxID=2502784 RepID=A0ABY5IWQ6_9FLAO|nr:hypothetical protein [Flavobacterium cerinum]UUC46715.1 hypothetical protein NOX80_05825 [Flavobacterium cerinum]
MELYTDYKSARSGVIGQSLTEYSFLDEQGNGVVGAQIDGSDVSGINFLNQEIINNSELTIFNYMPNAVGGADYDFKTRDVNDRPEGMSRNQYSYRGMLFQNVDGFSQGNNGTTVFASARDFGNVAAGYVAGNAGQPWRVSRLGFDGLQSWQEKGIATEGRPTQMAQKVGHNVGSANFSRRYQNQLNQIRAAKAKNTLLGPK